MDVITINSLGLCENATLLELQEKERENLKTAQRDAEILWGL